MTALRVLAQSIHDESIAPHDLELVQSNAQAEDAGLPLDELCCSLVRRAVARG